MKDIGTVINDHSEKIQALEEEIEQLKNDISHIWRIVLEMVNEES